ncbi:MAG TPA: ThuA domain-containing protein [Limnochordia bacterium]|nr:ThuA domain-containing protein [Limnochordia bacterium]
MSTFLHVGNPAGYHPFAPRAAAVTRLLAELGHAVENELVEGYEADFPFYNTERLGKLRGVVVSTTLGRFTADQIEALVQFVRGGGALIGIHSATDTAHDCDRYMNLIGGRFRTHPQQLDVTVQLSDPAHPITKGVAPFTLHEELYVMWYDPTHVHELLHTTSHLGARLPVAWTREEGRGRVFYISLGHREDVYENPHFLRLLKQGIGWAAGG